ncbi:MAG TPA: uroporphyrinogen decarboxylase family protein [Chthonomonadales bacterium]|nr:uroporphyrinogen decarboxylase family protein [Chthonomonadales bacterium]
MTPRERVLCALSHQEPDRTPRDFWAEPASLARLSAHLRLRDEEAILERFRIDLRRLSAREPPDRDTGGGVYENRWGERYVLRSTPWGPVRDDLPGALSAATADADRFPWPSVDDVDHRPLRDQAHRWPAHALLYGFADVWQRPALVRGWEPFFADMVERPELVHSLCARFVAYYREDYAQAQEAAGGRIDLFLLISDLGSQRGPLISMTMFREFVAPHLRAMVDRIHELGARVLFHSCGDIAVFIDDLVAIGIDALDPIQPVGEGMAPEALRRRTAGRLCLHGGIDMQRVLTQGSPDEVRREVRRYLDTFRGGGYILSPAHLFQPDVPPANIVAMYDEADRQEGGGF